MRKMMTKFVRDDAGATAIEYGLIATLIAVAIITVLGLVGSSLKTMFTSVSSSIKG